MRDHKGHFAIPYVFYNSILLAHFSFLHVSEFALIFALKFTYFYCVKSIAALVEGYYKVPFCFARHAERKRARNVKYRNRQR